jgi:hypothetical protein
MAGWGRNLFGRGSEDDGTADRSAAEPAPDGAADVAGKTGLLKHFDDQPGPDGSADSPRDALLTQVAGWLNKEVPEELTQSDRAEAYPGVRAGLEALGASNPADEVAAEKLEEVKLFDEELRAPYYGQGHERYDEYQQARREMDSEIKGYGKGLAELSRRNGDLLKAYDQAELLASYGDGVQAVEQYAAVLARQMAENDDYRLSTSEYRHGTPEYRARDGGPFVRGVTAGVIKGLENGVDGIQEPAEGELWTWVAQRWPISPELQAKLTATGRAVEQAAQEEAAYQASRPPWRPWTDRWFQL